MITTNNVLYVVDVMTGTWNINLGLLTSAILCYIYYLPIAEVPLNWVDKTSFGWVNGNQLLEYC